MKPKPSAPMTRTIVNDILVYSRHSADCSHADDTFYVKCECRKWLQYQRDGKQVRETAKTRSYTQAKKAAEDTSRLLRGEVVPVAAKTIESAVADYIKFTKKRIKRKKRMTDKLLAWAQKNGFVFLTELTTARLMEFRSSLPYATDTSYSLSVHWTLISGFFKWCHVLKLISENPMPDTRVHTQFAIEVKPNKVKPPSPEDVALVIASVDKVSYDPRCTTPEMVVQRKRALRLFMLTQRWTGMAIMDTATLRRDTLVNGVIDANRHKTDERFIVQIPKWLETELNALPCTDPEYFFWHHNLRALNRKIKDTSLVTWWETEVSKAFKAAKVQMTAHKFRHFFISQNLADGRSVDDVSTMCGVSPKVIRETYQHFIKEGAERMRRDQAAQWMKMGLDENGDPIPVTVN